MIILSIRTDKPEAEIGLFEDTEELAYLTWPAHRQLSETIHTKIEQLLKGINKDWKNIQGIICFSGPGSFTGLRIGLTVGNALAYGLGVPIVGSSGKDWLNHGTQQIMNGKNEKVIMPSYGAEAKVTQPKK